MEDGYKGSGISWKKKKTVGIKTGGHKDNMEEGLIFLPFIFKNKTQ